MEVKVKNQDFDFLLWSFSGHSPRMGNPIKDYGLVVEKTTIGAKNRVQKIIKLLSENYQSFNSSQIELMKKHGAIEEGATVSFPEGNIPDAYQTELKELMELENTLTFDPIDFNKYKDVETEHNYDWEKVSVFFENYA